MDNVLEQHPGVAVLFKPASLTAFVAGDLAEPRWAVERVWPEGASGVIAGRPKDGKSTLAVELAVSLWSGTPMFGPTGIRRANRARPRCCTSSRRTPRRVFSATCR